MQVEHCDPLLPRPGGETSVNVDGPDREIALNATVTMPVRGARDIGEDT
jgi:hypothetical protein